MHYLSVPIMIFTLDGCPFHYAINQSFRFVEGIWLHQKSRQIRFFFRKKDLVFIIRAQREMGNYLI